MHSESLLINALYYLLAAVISVPLFKRLGLGSILGYLFAGVVLGPHVLGLVDDPDEVLHFAEYGVILLLFIIGLELAPDKLWNMRGEIGFVGGSQLMLSAVLLTGFFLLVDTGLSQAVVLGLTLGLSSTAFAIQLMNEEHILASPLGRKGFSILLLQDLAVIPILLLLGRDSCVGNSGILAFRAQPASDYCCQYAQQGSNDGRQPVDSYRCRRIDGRRRPLHGAGCFSRRHNAGQLGLSASAGIRY